MNRALIVEDDKIQLKDLRIALQNAKPSMELITANNLEEAIREIDHSLVNGAIFSLFLLDIQLSVDSSNRDGFKIADFLRKQNCYYNTPVLFLTSIKNDVIMALHNYHCYNYITKPYTIDDIIKEIKHMILTGLLKEHSIPLRDTNGIRHNLVLEKIVYIQAKSHVLSLVTSYGTIQTREYTLTSIQKKLNTDFIQCHKSFVLNLQHVINYDKTNRIVKTTANEIPISRTYAKLFDEKLKTYQK